MHGAFGREGLRAGDAEPDHQPDGDRGEDRRLDGQAVQCRQRRAEPLLQQAVEGEGPREGQGDPRDPTGAEGQVEGGDEADADGHPLQRPQPFAEHDDAESDGDDRVEEVPEGRLGDVARTTTAAT